MEPNFWSADGNQEGGTVAVVDPADLRRAWAICRNADAHVQETGQKIGIGVELFERICSPGANIRAVWYRATMLQLLARMGLLTNWMRDADVTDAVLKAAATFPMEKMRTGVVYEGLPLDVQGFVKQIETESSR